jgi:hypothetical protein
MLLETHKLLTVFTELIPFKSTITLSLDEKNLIIQALFRKEKISYYYLQEYTLDFITNLEDEVIITSYIGKLEEFYKNAKKENLQESKLINQTVDWKGE